MVLLLIVSIGRVVIEWDRVNDSERTTLVLTVLIRDKGSKQSLLFNKVLKGNKIYNKRRR